MSDRGDSVLVVDDDVDLRSIVAEILADEGYSVATASNGRDALDALSRARASLILLDLMMPEMDGWEFRERQLASPELAEIPVVVFTAHANVAEAAATMAAAAGMQKPIDIGGLLAVVARVLADTRRGGDGVSH